MKTQASIDALSAQASATVDLVFWHRQWQSSEVRFKNPFRPVVVGFPFVLSVDPEVVSGKQLYETVARCLGVEAVEIDPVEDGNEGETLSRRGFGFQLMNTRSQGATCSFCSWTEGCVGCVIPNTEEALTVTGFSDAHTVCIDWGLARHEKQMADCLRGDVLEREEDASYKRMKQEEAREIGLEELLDEFTSMEELEGEDGVYCSCCKRKENQTKQIQVWRAPPVLVIHLGRFEHTAYRHRKLKHFVRYPLNDLSLHKYMVATSSPQTTSLPKSGEKQVDVPEEGLNETNTPNGWHINSLDATPASAESDSRSSTPTSILAEAKEAAEKHAEEGEGEGEIDGGSGPEYDERPGQAHKEVSLDSVLDSKYVGLQCYGGAEHGGHSTSYNLYAVVEHSGGVGAGHYVAVVKHEADGNWYCFDDERVFPIKPENVVSRNAYLLFYIRSDVDDADALDYIFPCHPVQQREMETRMKQSEEDEEDPASRCTTM